MLNGAFFRLEYLQVISLVTKDDFLNKFNVSISTKNFNNRLSKFLNFQHREYYGGQKNSQDKGNWTKDYQVNYTEVIGRNGLCYTFNFPSSEKIFNTNETSKKFIYKKSFSSATLIGFRETRKVDYPLRTLHAELGIEAKILGDRYQYYEGDSFYFQPMHAENGFQLTFHDPFEILSKESPSYLAMLNRRTLFKINPNKFEYDDSIDVHSLKE